ncbi:MAG: hypothetical protein LUC43_07630 [Burkholderiales bacterium]|nr:hypothetical protein [Burkholderiales bacterium]
MPETLIKYPVVIDPVPYGGYKAYCPDFEDTDVEASSMDEALEMVAGLVNYQVGMMLLEDRNASLPIPSFPLDPLNKNYEGNGRCYGWADVNPFALKMQIHTAELNAEAARNSQQGLQNSVKNIEQAAFLGVWLGGMSFFRK